MQNFAEQIAKLVEEVLGVEGVVAQETPADKAGDYGVPMFAFAKKLGKNPAEIAQELTENLQKNLPEWIARVEAAGPFVNFFLSENAWANVVEVALESDFLANESGVGETIVVDYGGENVAKPQSVGHLRSNIIGQAFVNCARKSGYEVIGDNHLGDWGTQFGKLAVAIEEWGDWDSIKQMQEPISELLRLYQKFHVEAENDENLVIRAREKFKNLTEGDADQLAQWELICQWTKENLQKTYERLGVEFDHYFGESFYRGEKMSQVVDMCEKANLVTKNEDGSWAIVPPEESGVPSFLIRKSDGATLYHTSDLAAINYRLQTWNPARIVYFVAEPQSLHFRQLFWLARQLWGEKSNFEHAVFGMVTLPSGQMSTRKGNTVKLEELLNEARDRALRVLEEKQPDLPKNEWENLAEKIGVGAVIYEDLSKDRTKNITFDWDSAINFEGQSAPYIQYTHARAMSILRKSDAQPEVVNYSDPYEIALIKRFLQAGEVLERVVEEAKPSYLAQWLYDLANDFNKFYANVSVLKSEGDALRSRLALVKATTDLLGRGLGMLGIHAPEKM